VRVLLADLPQRRPRAHVAPAEVDRDHRGGVGLLHHRVVDRIGRAGLEAVGVEADEIEIAGALRPRLAARLEDRGLMPRKLLEIASRAEHKHAAVPREPALLEEFPGGRGVGLLDEARHVKHAVVAGDRLAALDVAVGGRGVIRPDAERCEKPRARGGRGLEDRRVERLHVADQVVRRKHQHHGVRIARFEPEGGDRDRGRGVAADRLENLHPRRRADGAQLLGNEEAVLAVADHRRRLGAGEPAQAFDGLLEHRPLAHEGQELLREQLARHRPQPAPRAAAEDHRIDFRVHGLPHSTRRHRPPRLYNRAAP
jgi:hypothetical protein